jgi:hypothetical protein
LTGGATKTKQCELGGVESLAGRHLADRIRHRFDCDLEE